MKQVVGVPGMKVSSRPDDLLITYALGSCLGIAVHDPVAGVGGLLHVMLPSASLAPERARESPWMFVDTGVPALFRACYDLGARKERLVVKVAGGAAIQGGAAVDHFQIGRRNLLMLRQLFWKNGVLIHAQDVEGHLSRTLSLEIGSGRVCVWSDGSERAL